jgi:hypothetical protein
MTPPLPPSLHRAPPPRRVARFSVPSLPLFTVLFAFALAVLATATATPLSAAEPALPTADIVPDLPAKPVPPDDPALQAHLAGCAVWTDRCVTCEREAGRIFCSNIGIACQPQAVECVRSETAAEKKPGDEKDDKQEN